MKKNLLLIIIALIIVPQISFASWWNPFSWNIFSSLFHSKEQTQIVVSGASQQEGVEATSTPSSTSTPLSADVGMILCNGQYYKKCEVGQLLVCPTDAKVEAYCSIPKTPKVKSNVVITPKKDTPDNTVTTVNTQNTQKTNSNNTSTKDENFSSVAASALLSQAKSYQDLVDFADGVIEYIDIGLDELNTLVAKHEGFVLGLGTQNSEISQAYISDYKGDITKTNVYRANLVTQRDTASKNVLYYKNLALEKSTKFVTRKESISLMEELQKETNWNLSKEYIFEIYDGYKAYRKDRDNYYVKVDAQLRAVYSQMSSEPSSIPTYQPQPTPQVQLPTYTPPQYTNCTISGDGGVGLQAYVNCTSY